MSRGRKAQEDRLLVDWLRIVFPYDYVVTSSVYRSKRGNDIGEAMLEKSPHEFVTDVVNFLLLGANWNWENVESQWAVQEFPLWNYDYMLQRGNIKLLYNSPRANRLDEEAFFLPENRAKMGVALEISGQGVRELEAYMDDLNWTWNRFFNGLYEKFPKARITRLDLALDTFRRNRKATPRNMRNLANGGLISSKCTYSKFFEQIENRTGEIQGETYYLGKSPVQLRVYDKRAERIYSHGDTMLEVPFWVRWELQLMEHKSQGIARAMADGEKMSDLYFDMLSGHLSVLPKPKEKEKNPDLKIAEWWSEFVDIESRRKLNLCRPCPPNVYQRKLDWIDKQVAMTLYQQLWVHKFVGNDWKQLLRHWIEQGKAKLSDEDFKQMVTYAGQHFKKLEEVEVKSEAFDELEKELIDDLENIEAEWSQIEVDENLLDSIFGKDFADQYRDWE